MLVFPDRWKSRRTRYQEDRPHRMLALEPTCGCFRKQSRWRIYLRRLSRLAIVVSRPMR
jgi:hypothetical protein